MHIKVFQYPLYIITSPQTKVRKWEPVPNCPIHQSRMFPGLLFSFYWCQRVFLTVESCKNNVVKLMNLLCWKLLTKRSQDERRKRCKAWLHLREKRIAVLVLMALKWSFQVRVETPAICQNICLHNLGLKQESIRHYCFSARQHTCYKGKYCMVYPCNTGELSNFFSSLTSNIFLPLAASIWSFDWLLLQ